MRHDFNIAIGFGREKVEHNVKRRPKTIGISYISLWDWLASSPFFEVVAEAEKSDTEWRIVNVLHWMGLGIYVFIVVTVWL